MTDKDFDNFDSYIFDMDGTLWDAVDTYCAIWNSAIERCGLSLPAVTRERLAPLMGMPLTEIYDSLVGNSTDRDAFFAVLQRESEEMMPRMGGRLYPEVEKVLAGLARRARLFMVSNCNREGLPSFLEFTGLAPYFTETLSYGATGRQKDENIMHLVEKYRLINPVYVGDTAGDMKWAHRAGVPFAWASYGFGADVRYPDYTLHTFTDLLALRPVGSARESASEQVNLLPGPERDLRFRLLFEAMRADGMEAALVRDNANVYYLTGRVFRGFIYLDSRTGYVQYFVRRPSHLEGPELQYIRKVEEIPALLAAAGRKLPGTLACELDSVAYSEIQRMHRAFGYNVSLENISEVLRRVRSVKTPYEQTLLRHSGIRHTLVYDLIPRLYRTGMTDLELQIEIERLSRLGGCLGQFRVAGSEMELFMGNVLTGANADSPSPYDFAMGGRGLHPSIPVGADGSPIEPGCPVMVDVNGNYTGYMTDMTRCFIKGDISPEVAHAHDTSVRICRELAEMMRPGAQACDLYKRAVEIAAEEGLEENFMGYSSHAGFVGHGIGIEVNELPVIAPRSRDVLQAGNVIALEPKFVLPGRSAVGIENTYIVQPDGPAEVITFAPVEIRKFEVQQYEPEG